MIDLATLNLKIDSTDVREGVGQLDKLTAAGTRAEAATDRLEAGFDSAAVSANRLTQAETRLVAANDRFGASMRGASNVTRAMQANMLNLSRQGADVATMFALGAPPMQIFASQGLQIVDVLAMMSKEAKETGSSLGAMTAQGLARVGPYALIAAAGATALAAVLSDVTDEINENSSVTVTWHDTLLGAMDAVAAYASTTLTDAFQSLGIDVGAVWQFIQDVARQQINTTIGHFVLAATTIKEVWTRLPGVFFEIVTNIGNAVIGQLELMLNRGITMINVFGAAANSVFGTEFDPIGAIDLPGLTNAFDGSGRGLGNALAAGVDAAYRDYLRDGAAFVAPWAAARAGMDEAADEAGTSAGRRLDRAAAAQIGPEIEAALRKAAEAAEIEADRIRSGKDAQAEADRNLQNKIKAEVEAQEQIQEEARRLEEDRIRDMAEMYQALFTRGIDGIWDFFKRQGMETLSQLASQGMMRLLSGGGSGGGGLLGILGGSAANDNGAPQASGLLSMFGASGGPLAAGGPVGAAVAAAAIAFNIGKSIEKALSTPKGIANLTGTSILSSTGSLAKQATGAGGSVLDSIASIAEALGGSVGTGGAVSISMRGKNWRVDPTGGGATKKGKGAIDFGQDQEAAIAYAVRNLIEDGVLTGISQAARNLLGAGGDLEKAIEQAAMIESVPKLLKERLDPLGAALDTIDERFGKLVEALRAGGATAQQFADAERLYNLERAEAIAQVGSAAQTLKDFAASLAYGSNSPLSVKSQLASARSALAGLDPTKDQEKYVNAAQAVLALSRQANGSSGAYFADFNAINGQLQGAIGTLESGASTQAPGVIFQQQTASNTASMAAMLQDHTALLRSIDAKLTANDNTETGSKIGKKRGFAK